MKKFMGIAVLVLAAYGAMAQNQVTLKMKVAPNHHYVSALKMDMDMQMTVSSADGKTADAGQPVLMTMGYSLTGDMKTKAAAADIVPFNMGIKMTVASMKMNGNEMASPVPPVNETLYGNYDMAGKMTIDSVGGKKDDAVKTAMIKLADEFQNGLKFPEKPLKIGETFTQELPMDMPVAGASVKMKSTITYKLTSIADKKAYFDLTYLIASDVGVQGMAMTMSGGGDGKLIFDMVENYPVSNIGTMNITYSMAMPQAQDMKMAGKMKMTTTNTTVISAN